jgi:hypothetical protein
MRGHFWQEILEKRWFFSALSLSAAIPCDVDALTDFVVAEDFDRDGFMDAAVSSYDSDSITFLLGSEDGLSEPSIVTVQLAHPPDHLVVADVNHDSSPDLVAISGEEKFATVLINNGKGKFSHVLYPLGAGYRAAVMAELDDSNAQDIVLSRYNGKTIGVCYNNGSGGFGSPTPYPVDFTPTDIVAVDFNSDGRTDLAAADFFSDSVHVLLNQGSRSLTQVPGSSTVDQGPASITSGDFNGDLKPDLVTANFLAGSISILLGNGDGTFQPATKITTGRGATFVTSTDLDNDGKTDLVVVNANDDTISILRGLGDGDFDTITSRSTGASPRSATVAQFNSDGLLDIAVANQADSTVSFFSSDLIPPTVTLASTSAIKPGGAQPCELTIRVSDSAVVDNESIGTGDLIVSGPNGFSASAQFDRIVSSDTKSTSAVFRLMPPGGYWDPSDSGAHTVSLADRAVFDSAGNPAAAGTIGTLTITARDAGNSFTTAMNLGTIAKGKVKTLDDSISPADRYDVFRFTLKTAARVYGRMTQLSDNADLQLFNSANKRIAYSKHSGVAEEAFDQNLAAGSYSARVIVGKGAAGSGYRLRIRADAPTPPPSNDRTLKIAKNLGLLVRGKPITFNDYVGTNDSLDLIRFRIDTPATALLKLSGLSDNTNLALLDSKGQLIASSSKSGKSNEQITRSLSSGWYYARLTFKGFRYTLYTLRLSVA